MRGNFHSRHICCAILRPPAPFYFYKHNAHFGIMRSGSSGVHRKGSLFCTHWVSTTRSFLGQILLGKGRVVENSNSLVMGLNTIPKDAIAPRQTEYVDAPKCRVLVLVEHLTLLRLHPD